MSKIEEIDIEYDCKNGKVLAFVINTIIRKINQIIKHIYQDE